MLKVLTQPVISDFTYEFIYTMDQSGSQGASDSTYGWDNYLITTSINLVGLIK